MRVGEATNEEVTKCESCMAALAGIDEIAAHECDPMDVARADERRKVVREIVASCRALADDPDHDAHRGTAWSLPRGEHQVRPLGEAQGVVCQPPPADPEEGGTSSGDASEQPAPATTADVGTTSRRAEAPTERGISTCATCGGKRQVMPTRVDPCSAAWDWLRCPDCCKVERRFGERGEGER